MNSFSHLSKAFLVAFICYGCDVHVSPTPTVTKIRYGVSSGECVGYCDEDLTLTSTKLTFEMTSVDQMPVSCSQTFTKPLWTSLTKKIDVEKFNETEAVSGCPGCTDIPVEWIEITTAFTIHKVSFDYGDAPEEAKDYIEDLRALMRGMNKCN